jgi:hypothetical protein
MENLKFSNAGMLIPSGSHCNLIIQKERIILVIILLFILQQSSSLECLLLLQTCTYNLKASFILILFYNLDKGVLWVITEFFMF